MSNNSNIQFTLSLTLDRKETCNILSQLITLNHRIISRENGDIFTLSECIQKLEQCNALTEFEVYDKENKVIEIYVGDDSLFLSSKYIYIAINNFKSYQEMAHFQYLLATSKHGKYLFSSSCSAIDMKERYNRTPLFKYFLEQQHKSAAKQSENAGALFGFGIADNCIIAPQSEIHLRARYNGWDKKLEQYNPFDSDDIFLDAPIYKVEQLASGATFFQLTECVDVTTKDQAWVDAWFGLYHYLYDNMKPEYKIPLSNAYIPPWVKD